MECRGGPQEVQARRTLPKAAGEMPQTCITGIMELHTLPPAKCLMCVLENTWILKSWDLCRPLPLIGRGILDNSAPCWALVGLYVKQGARSDNFQ